MGRNTGRGKVAYSWISADPVKAGPTLGVVVVVVVVVLLLLLLLLLLIIIIIIIIHKKN